MKICPFCELNKEKTRVIEESRFSRVIFSNPRMMPGHLLTIPKQHVEKLSELTKVELDDLMVMTIKYQEKIVENLASGCDIRQNYRPFIKEGELKVSHLHFHIQPRWPDVKDELFMKCQIHEFDLFKPLLQEEMKKIIKLLKS